MNQEQNQSPDYDQEKVYAYAINALGAGVDRAEVIAEMEKMGVPSTAAANIADVVSKRLQKSNNTTGGSLLMGLIGGLAAAVIGGVVWAWLTLSTGYEIGFVAWGIGLLCGFAVMQLAGGKTGPAFQVVAVLASILGIAIGKYGTFFYEFKRVLSEEYGSEAVASFTLFSTDAIQTFTEYAGDLFGAYDLLWVGLAVVTAWRVAERSE